MMPRRFRAELALAGVTLIWGTTFVMVKAALTEVSAFLYLAIRFSLAAIVLTFVYKRKGRCPAPPVNGGTFAEGGADATRFARNSLMPGLLAGGLLFTAYVFQTFGLKLTTPSKSAFLTGLSIPMVPLASSIVYKIRPRLVEIAGILVASAGMMLMTLTSASSRFGMNRGDVLSFLCAVVFALHIVVIGHYSPIIGFEPLAVIQIAVVAVAGAVLSTFAEPLRLHWTPAVVATLLMTGLLATAVAFTTQAWAQQYTSPARAALIFALEPVVAWLTSYALTGETLANRGKVGAGMILAGILLVECTGNRNGPETNGVKVSS
jgi:drug/metabolite transporter (DMT)-like permease